MGVVKFNASSHGGSNDVTIVGTHSVDGTTRVVTGNGVTVTLTTGGLTNYERQASNVARGDYVVVE